MERRTEVVIRKRRRREICKSHEAPREIPFDLVIEILWRLPTKSQMRFKSVSKLWSFLICSKYFTNRLPEVSTSPPRLYMWLRFEDDRNMFLSSSSSPDSDVQSFVIDQDLTVPAMQGYSFSHVFRSLMCFTKGPSAQIYNTSTRQLVVLPDMFTAENLKSRTTRFVFYTGHDSVHDQYKVFCTVSRSRHRVGNIRTYISEHWVFLLGGDRWRKIPSPCPPHVPSSQHGLAFKGRMHYIAMAHLPCPVVVSFDICSEEFSMHQLPEDHALFHPHFTHLIEFGGRVAVLDHTDIEDEGVMELWVMEDAEKNVWLKKTLGLDSSQMHILNMHMVDNMGLRVQCTTRNGTYLVSAARKYSNSAIKKSYELLKGKTLMACSMVFVYHTHCGFISGVFGALVVRGGEDYGVALFAL
ncbi:unnamed protein product [Microthlaspi erraticum]|uniref:F-box domain-containing protein n=1 Tax=Microthlaspi erraticum TaxID=1685480 RepID=A0A6D2I1Z6_9BRAS|nr:unnamed protein product [Microthlaspi erraticum]